MLSRVARGKFFAGLANRQRVSQALPHMKITLTLVSTLLTAGALSALAEVDVTKLPPVAPQKDVTYAKDIKPLLDASCIRCHGEKEKKGGLRLDSLEAVLKGGKDGHVVEAGQSAKSKLVLSVSQLDPETAMPPQKRGGRGPRGPGGPGGGTNAPAGGLRPAGPGGPGGGFQPPKPLTAEQVGLVRAWIDQGAK